VIDHVFAEEFLEEVRAKSDYLVKKLNEILPLDQFEVRGQGLLIGIDCKEDVASFIRQAEEAGLLVVQAGANVIRLLPPLTVTEQEIDQAIDILTSILLVPTTI
jgi:acetylornithine/N-succinyldiaminopimelate aminotransferase